MTTATISITSTAAYTAGQQDGNAGRGYGTTLMPRTADGLVTDADLNSWLAGYREGYMSTPAGDKILAHPYDGRGVAAALDSLGRNASGSLGQPYFAERG